MRSVLPRAGRRGLLNGRRDGHSGRLEHLATTPLDLAPEQEPLPVLLHLDHLQPVQITDHIGPLPVVAPLLQSGLQLLAAPPTPGTSRTRVPGSSRHICGRSAASATATCTTGTTAPPSRVACTVTPRRPSPTRCSCGAPTCRRSGRPRPPSPHRSGSDPGHHHPGNAGSPCCRPATCPHCGVAPATPPRSPPGRRRPCGPRPR